MGGDLMGRVRQQCQTVMISLVGSSLNDDLRLVETRIFLSFSIGFLKI